MKYPKAVDFYTQLLAGLKTEPNSETSISDQLMALYDQKNDEKHLERLVLRQLLDMRSRRHPFKGDPLTKQACLGLLKSIVDDMDDSIAKQLFADWLEFAGLKEDHFAGGKMELATPTGAPDKRRLVIETESEEDATLLMQYLAWRNALYSGRHVYFHQSEHVTV